MVCEISSLGMQSGSGLPSAPHEGRVLLRAAGSPIVAKVLLLPSRMRALPVSATL